MCLAIPGKVIRVTDKQVEVAYPSENRLVFLSGDKPKVGDYVLVQMGIVVKILTPEEAKKSLSAWKEL